MDSLKTFATQTLSIGGRLIWMRMRANHFIGRVMLSAGTLLHVAGTAAGQPSPPLTRLRFGRARRKQAEAGSTLSPVAGSPPMV
jgi:hypothetical protein